MQRTPDGRVIVRFIGTYGSYGRGMKAGFPEKVAKDLVENKKVAVHIAGATIPERPVLTDEDIETLPPPPKPAVVNEDDPLAEILSDPDWRKIHGNKLRAIAAKVSEVPLTSKEDAIAAIELALEGRE